MQLVLSSRGGRNSRLQSGGRGGVLGYDKQAGLACVRAESAGDRVTGLSTGTLLAAGKHSGGVGSGVPSPPDLAKRRQWCIAPAVIPGVLVTDNISFGTRRNQERGVQQREPTARPSEREGHHHSQGTVPLLSARVEANRLTAISICS